MKRGGQYFVGNSFSWADLHLLQFVDLIVSQEPKVFRYFEFIFFLIFFFNVFKVLESSPALANNVQRTRDLPNIRKWLNERPENAF